MRIGGPSDSPAYAAGNAANLRLGKAKGQDSFSLAVNEQIKTLQEQIRDLAENEEMTVEMKQDKRKELQAQIKDLRKQLIQWQLEQRQAEREKKAKAMREQAERQAPGGKSGSAGIRASVMQGIMEADAGLSQVRAAGTVKSRAEDQVRTLKDEIARDTARGFDTAMEEEQLAFASGQIRSADSFVSGELADIARTNRETGEAGRDRKDSIEPESLKGTAAAEPEPKAAGVSDKRIRCRPEARWISSYN